MVTVMSEKKRKKLVPQLRFKGFTGDWEQRKYADFLTESRIPGHSGATARKLTVKLWGKGVVEKSTVENGSSSTQYYIRKNGQLMYGKLDFLHAAFGIVPTSLNTYESTADSPAFDISRSASPNFILMSCLRKELYLYQGSAADGSRKAKRVHVPTFLQMELILPELREQNAISDFFEALDSLIAAHERKLDLLKKKKTYYLQQIFSQKLRFEGFTEPWEQRKLGEIFEVSTEKNTNLTFGKDDVISVARMRRITADADSNDDYMKTYNTFRLGDIAYEGHKSNEFAFGRLVMNTLRNGIVSHVFTVYRPRRVLSLAFMSRYIHSEFVMRRILLMSTSTALMMSSLNSVEFLKQKIAIPTESEQQLLGIIFDCIDHLAEAQYLRVLSLKELKLAYLQKMFV
jgi:type I restriction enzyme S subunit